jgi:uncharacterized membrane protein YqjE
MSDKGKNKAGTSQGADDEGLPALVGRLGEHIVTLLDTKLTLLKLEIKEDITGYARSGLSIGVGGLLVVVGFVLLNIAFAFLVSALFETTRLSPPVKYALGFLLTGGLYLTAGAIVTIKAKNRLGKQNLTPEESLQEIEKDEQWLRREL